MGQVLYRKYRSKSLDEIVGQEHITNTLKNALKTGAISHAYLFTGPRGVGKTSIARILAHELNELPYSGEDMHLDIIEIDAASNRGIDEIRDLREKVNMAPAAGKYKVYIIDEVHMLTTPAFNALLKTLEEPPAHVVFILATTEVHKLPETIVSRTQRYTFRPVEQTKVVAHLKHIAKKEKLSISDDALELIAEHGEGSFRDSISLLNQAAGHASKITADIVQELLGLPPAKTIQTLFASIHQNDKAATVQLLSELYTQGYQAGMIAKELGKLGRQAVLADKNDATDEAVLLRLLTSLIDVPASPAPERLLEIVLLQAVRPTAAQSSVPISAGKTPTKSAKPESKTVAPAIIAQSQTVTTDTAEIAVTEPRSDAQQEEIKSTFNADGVVDLNLDALWPQLLSAIKTTHNTVYGILRMANPELTDSGLTLTFKYAFHQKRMNEAKHRKIISDAVERLTGQHLAIECRYDKDTQERPPIVIDASLETVTALVPKEDEASITTISNIFGGGELLES